MFYKNERASGEVAFPLTPSTGPFYPFRSIGLYARPVIAPV